MDAPNTVIRHDAHALRWISRGVVIAFAVLALVAASYFAGQNATDRLRDSQLRGCERDNQLRAAINLNRTVLAHVLIASRTDADHFAKLRRQLTAFRIVNCVKAYPNP